MTKYVISGYIGFDNFGDEAIAKVLISHLKNIGAEKITVISSNPQKTSETYGVCSCKMLDFIKPIMESDTLISGGGSLLQDITSLKSLLYYLSIIMFALTMGKKVVVFAQGFTPFKTKIGRFLTGFVLKFCQKITVRDTKSQKILKMLNVQSELVSDPVFGINTISNKEKEGVGIQLRSFLTLNDAFLNILADEVAKNFYDKKIKLISLQDSLDLIPLYKFQEMLASRNINSEIIKNLSVSEAIETISSLEYLIGMRFHACLVGAKARVKTLGIKYDIKVENLAKNVGFPFVRLKDRSLEEGFQKLKNTNPDNYNIPTFEFPEI